MTVVVVTVAMRYIVRRVCYTEHRNHRNEDAQQQYNLCCHGVFTCSLIEGCLSC